MLWSKKRALPRRPSPADTVGRALPPLSGATPDGEEATLDLDGPHCDIVFLTSECAECREVWEWLRDWQGEITVVTPGPETDSRRKVSALAATCAAGVRVLMSSGVWHAFQVTGAPWKATVAHGVVVGSEPFKLPYRPERSGPGGP